MAFESRQQRGIAEIVFTLPRRPLAVASGPVRNIEPDPAQGAQFECQGEALVGTHGSVGREVVLLHWRSLVPGPGFGDAAVSTHLYARPDVMPPLREQEPGHMFGAAAATASSPRWGRQSAVPEVADQLSPGAQ